MAKRRKTRKTKQQNLIDDLLKDFENLFTQDAKKKKKPAKKKAAKKKKGKLEYRDIFDEDTEGFDSDLDLNNSYSNKTSDYINAIFDDLDVSQNQEDVYNDTLKRFLNGLKRRYKKVTPKRFLYNTSADLRKKYSSIKVNALLYSTEKGYSMMAFDQRTKKALSLSQWTTKFTRETKAYGHSVHNILTQRILPAIRNKSGDDWRFISLIGWSGNAIQQAKNTNKSKRDKTTKKRNANARNKHRRR